MKETALEIGTPALRVLSRKDTAKQTSSSIVQIRKGIREEMSRLSRIARIISLLALVEELAAGCVAAATVNSIGVYAALAIIGGGALVSLAGIVLSVSLHLISSEVTRHLNKLTKEV